MKMKEFEAPPPTYDPSMKLVDINQILTFSDIIPHGFS